MATFILEESGVELQAAIDAAQTALQPSDIASGAITARAGNVDFSGGSDGHVLTVQADGSLAPEAPAGVPVEGTAVLSTGETGGSKFLREDGDGTCSWQTLQDSLSVIDGGSA